MAVEAIHLGEERIPEPWSVQVVTDVAGRGLEGECPFHSAGPVVEL